jgi:hypothetical protein
VSGGIVDRAGLRLLAVAGSVVLALVVGFVAGRADGTPAPAGAAVPGGVIPSHDHGPQAALAIGADVSGLAVSAGGYTLVAGGLEFVAGRPRPFTFRIDGPAGKPVTTFAIRHEKPLHLIVVRRDLAGYRHLHPTMAPGGTWSIDLTLPEPGAWRAYADFTAVEPGGAEVSAVLGVDLVAVGAFRPRALPAASDTSTVDGLAVTYAGQFRVGPTQPLLFWVPAQVQPYLGTYGHLVILRAGDLLFVHVHAEIQLANGAVKFWTAAPSPGRYRMFFDFQVDGTVRTAEYTLVV